VTRRERKGDGRHVPQRPPALVPRSLETAGAVDRADAEGDGHEVSLAPPSGAAKHVRPVTVAGSAHARHASRGLAPSQARGGPSRVCPPGPLLSGSPDKRPERLRPEASCPCRCERCRPPYRPLSVLQLSVLAWSRAQWHGVPVPLRIGPKRRISAGSVAGAANDPPSGLKTHPQGATERKTTSGERSALIHHDAWLDEGRHS